MAAAPTLTWEQYQQLPPEKRQRPLTPAEYAALTKQQRITGGLEEDEQGAPTDFNGPVFPNPEHLQIHDDSEPTIPVTRLPQGVTFNKQNWSGSPQMDVSNPAPAEVIPAMGREIAAKMSTQPVNYDALAQQHGAVANQDVDYDALAQQHGATDANTQAPPRDRFAEDRATTEAWAQKHPILGPIARFLVSGGQNAANAITDTPGQLYHAIVDPSTDDEAGLTPEQRLVFRLGGKQAIEAGADYASGKVSLKGAASVLPEALGTGVGQVAGGAVYGKAGDVAGDVLPKLPAAAKAAATSETAAKLAATSKVLGASAEELPVVGKFIKAGKKLSDIRDIWNGKITETPDLDATGENKPFAGGTDEPPPPKPGVRTLDATGENKPHAGGEDEYVPPVPKKPVTKVAPPTAQAAPAPVASPEPVAAESSPQASSAAQPVRVIVRDPQTGQPEFSDVLAAKQAKAAPPETDPVLAALRERAERIQQAEPTVPGNEDLTDLGIESVARAKAMRGIAEPAERPVIETEAQFKARLAKKADTLQGAIDKVAAKKAGTGSASAAGDLSGIFQRLVKGEAGQAGLPGSVTDADEGIAEIQNRPVLATKTGEVPARGYLNMVGADQNSILKTQRDLDSVFYHRQQIAANGTPSVELHVDEGGNVIGAQGRHRALAALQQGGPNAKVRVTIYKHPSPSAE